MKRGAILVALAVAASSSIALAGGISFPAATGDLASLACQLTGGANCVMTGAIRADDGTATCGGGITWDGDTDTSITCTAADSLGLCLANEKHQATAKVSGDASFVWSRTGSTSTTLEGLAAVDFFSEGTTANYVRSLLFSSTNATDRPYLHLIRGRGTADSPVAVASGDALGNIEWGGMPGTTAGLWARSVVMEALASEAWTGSAIGATWNLLTTPNGSLVPVQRIFVDDDGQVVVGAGITEATAGLHVYDNSNGNSRLNVQQANTGNAAQADVQFISDGASMTVGCKSTTFAGTVGGVTAADACAMRTAGGSPPSSFVIVNGAAVPLYLGVGDAADFTIEADHATRQSVTVSANNNLAGSIACNSTNVRKLVIYSDTGSSKVSQCFCAQTGAAAYAWEGTHTSADCT